MMNFTYTVTEPPDGQWGAIRPDGTWTGMVGMLQEKKVDLCMRHSICIYRGANKGLYVLLSRTQAE